jgi:alcohol dehydrogenase class IV
MDALSHAIESYVSLDATPISEMYGLQAIRLIKKSLERLVSIPMM